MNIHKLPFFAESWNVAYRKKQNGIPFMISEMPYILIKNSFRYWAADPFLFETGKDVFVFAELYDYVLRRGTIGYYQINAKKPRWIPVIQEKYHLSFPFIYVINDEIYILPEASESNSLYRYRAVDFPQKWVKEAPIFENVKFADTTPISEYGYDLALTYDLENSSLKILCFSENTEGLLFQDIEGVRRPAGFIDKKMGLRAAQDCHEDYGRGIILYRFELLKNKFFYEYEYKRVDPSNVILSKNLYIDGMHTYNQSKHYEVIDIKTRRFSILNFGMRLVHLFRRILQRKR